MLLSWSQETPCISNLSSTCMLQSHVYVLWIRSDLSLHFVQYKQSERSSLSVRRSTHWLAFIYDFIQFFFGPILSRNSFCQESLQAAIHWPLYCDCPMCFHRTEEKGILFCCSLCMELCKMTYMTPSNHVSTLSENRK